MCGICGILSFNDNGVGKKELFLFRDRIGIKPLYYTIDDQHAVERYYYSIIIMFAIMGCSVIIVGNDNRITPNPMPEYGKGKIWDMVFDLEGLGQTLIRLSQYRHKNPDDIVVMADELRDLFITKATEQKYIELFDL